MKIKNHKKVNVRGTISRSAAEWLLKQLKENVDFDCIVKDIERQLKPIYFYKINCRCCGCQKTMDSQKEFTKEEIKKIEEHWICGSCMNLE